MDERSRFVIACDEAVFGMSELCRSFGVSRRTGYKWLARYRAGGVEGLREESRAPRSCPHRTREEVVSALIALKRKHPSWGPAKLLVRLEAERPDLAEALPAVSTAGDILKRAGLVKPRRIRERAARSRVGGPAVAEGANDVWPVDFKGEFRTRDGRYCYPLTVTDLHSRCLLACEGLASTGHQGARAVFERLFSEVGLPVAIRTDNGSPFSSAAIGGLSRLSVWWIKLGIVHQLIRPGCPQENGAHERMHRTLKAETTRPPALEMVGQQERFAAFQAEYNTLRPHEALGMRTPASLWTPSTRPPPLRPPEPEYEGHWLVRRVNANGRIKLFGLLLFVSEVLEGESVALEVVDDGIYSLFFHRTLLGRLDRRRMKITPLPRRMLVPSALASSEDEVAEE